MRQSFAAIVIAATMTATAALAAAPAADKIVDALKAAVDAPSRTPANTARDHYRHPAETLAFFGVKPTDTVVELFPGGGWYTEILAPYLRDKGSLVVAGPDKGLNGVRALAAKDAARYGKIEYAPFPATDGQAPSDQPGVPDGTADVVLTFRNVHNLRFAGVDHTQAAFNQMFRMLKPGGILGVEEHRLPESRAAAEEEKSGYMKVSSVVGFAKAAGFELVGESEVNANPKDTADWPAGVWTLPPSYALKDADREKYAAIGESDRMTLKFRKPKK